MSWWNILSVDPKEINMNMDRFNREFPEMEETKRKL